MSTPKTRNNGSRAPSLSVRDMERKRHRLPVFEADHDEYDPRPTKRGDCIKETGPCPWVSCRHHLYLEANELNGSITINFPGKEPWEIGETCSLRVADEGDSILGVVGGLLNITRERARQLEVRAIDKLKKRLVEGDM